MSTVRAMQTYSLSAQLLRNARLHPDRVALIFDRQVLSWQGMLERTRRLATMLVAEGAGAGDRIAILANNSADYVALYFAIPWIGAIAAPINTRLTADEINAVLSAMDIRLLLHDQAHAELAAQTTSRRRSDLSRIAVDAFKPTVDPAPVDQYADAMIFHTGGTTGLPKGVVLNQQSLLVNSLQWCVATGCNASDRFLIAPPMFHLVAGMNTIAGAMLGAAIVVLPRFDPESVLTAIQTHQVTKAAMVPVMLDMLFKSPNFGVSDLSSLRRVSYGGAPISPELLDRTLRMLPGIKLYQIYGQTECCGTVTCLGPEDHVPDDPAGKLRSAGRPIPLTEVAILDPDGRPLATGEVGEICVRAPSTSTGYFNNPEASAALFEFGWLHTGDAGYLDDDGFVFIVDRIKDMIVTGGENVFAVEVEQHLYLLDGVLQCAVIGVASDSWGEQVHAVVHPAPGVQLSSEQVIAHCKAGLAGYKCPKSVSFSEQPLPMSAMGKILKRALRDAMPNA